MYLYGINGTSPTGKQSTGGAAYSWLRANGLYKQVGFGIAEQK